MLRDGHELAVGGFHKLLQGVDRVAPLPIGQAGFDSLQLGQGDAVGAVELHGLGEVEAGLGAKHADLRGGRRRNPPRIAANASASADGGQRHRPMCFIGGPP